MLSHKELMRNYRLIRIGKTNPKRTQTKPNKPNFNGPKLFTMQPMNSIISGIYDDVAQWLSTSFVILCFCGFNFLRWCYESKRKIKFACVFSALFLWRQIM